MDENTAVGLPIQYDLRRVDIILLLWWVGDIFNINFVILEVQKTVELAFHSIIFESCQKNFSHRSTLSVLHWAYSVHLISWPRNMDSLFLNTFLSFFFVKIYVSNKRKLHKTNKNGIWANQVKIIATRLLKLHVAYPNFSLFIMREIKFVFKMLNFPMFWSFFLHYTISL